MKSGSQKSVADAGERRLIEHIRRVIERSVPGGQSALGDDAAVLPPKRAEGRQVVSTDVLVEGTHWADDHLSASQLGRRALVANLSDLAAMGASPDWFTLGLGLPGDMPLAKFQGIVRGLAKAAAEFDCPWVGGDIVRSPVATLAITVAGDCRQAPVTRAGARSGQSLFVTGDLGRAALALDLLTRGENVPRSIAEKHVRPQPRLREAAALASSKAIGSMMDVSDGLARDLPWIAELSSVRLEINLDSLPIRAGVGRTLQRDARDVASWAASSGEEFELAFTTSLRADRVNALMAKAGTGISATRIGEVREGSGVRWLWGGKPVEVPTAATWDHFSQGRGRGST